jgi:hypothetical protein
MIGFRRKMMGFRRKNAAGLMVGFIFGASK